MVASKIKYWVTISVLFFSFMSFAQKHVFTEVQSNTGKVYVGEPAEISLTVYTSTWFTSGVDVPNIKVEGAFTVFFRSVSLSKSINGKTYAAVRFIYNIYPYTEDDIRFPEMTIGVETPNDGDYKGVKRNVKSKGVDVKVRPVPPGFEKSDWLVTPNLTVKDRWQGNLKNVKVGDVLQRSIYRKADETVSELIPPLVWDSIEGVSLYPERAVVNNNKTKATFNADRTDAMRYLFEKEGEVIIPEMTLMWWNAKRKKVYKKTLPAVVINVLPNPDLGMVESIKDSLALEKNTQISSVDQEEEPFSFLGLNWKQLIIAILVLLVILKYMVKIIEVIVKNYKEKRRAYLGSEKYFFHQFLKSLSKDQTKRRNAFYRWIDCLELEEYSLNYFTRTYFTENGESEKIISSRTKWVSARKNYWKKRKNGILRKRTHWINP